METEGRLTDRIKGNDEEDKGQEDITFPVENMPQYRLVFRGDSHSPYGTPNNPKEPGVFGTGFKSRNFGLPTMTASPQMLGGEESTEGVDTETGVCVSTLLGAAAMFPQDSTEYVNIYAMGINVLTALNTHGKQATNALKMARKSGGDNVWHFTYLYAHELAVKEIPPKDVLACVRIKRTFQGSEPVSYSILSWEINNGCPCPRKIKELFEKVIKDMQEEGAQRIPTVVDGFVSRSKGRHLTREEFDKEYDKLL